MNVNKFRGKIVERGLNVESLAIKMGIDKATVYRKINNNGDTFTVKETRQIVSILELTTEEIMSIFFNNTVA